jgi:hypothetical protein
MRQMHSGISQSLTRSRRLNPWPLGDRLRRAWAVIGRLKSCMPGDFAFTISSRQQNDICSTSLVVGRRINRGSRNTIAFGGHALCINVSYLAWRETPAARAFPAPTALPATNPVPAPTAAPVPICPVRRLLSRLWRMRDETKRFVEHTIPHHPRPTIQYDSGRIVATEG